MHMQIDWKVSYLGDCEGFLSSGFPASRLRLAFGVVFGVVTFGAGDTDLCLGCTWGWLEADKLATVLLGSPLLLSSGVNGSCLLLFAWFRPEPGSVDALRMRLGVAELSSVVSLVEASDSFLEGFPEMVVETFGVLDRREMAFLGLVLALLAWLLPGRW